MEKSDFIKQYKKKKRKKVGKNSLNPKLKPRLFFFFFPKGQRVLVPVRQSKGQRERKRDREVQQATMSLIAGSYEKYIWGFKLKPHQAPSLALTPLFSYPSHQSPITTVASFGNVAASGGADDTIHLYDLPSASYLGSLHDHSASITSLSFYSPPHLSFPRNLISAAADGTVSIFDADPFVLLKSLRPHRQAVNDLSVHPSGKLALTVSRDGCLAMLNLVRGKRSFCGRIGKEASLVKFDVGGDRFFMVAEDKVGVHEAEDARLVCELENPKKKRVLCAATGEVCFCWDLCDFGCLVLGFG